MTANHTAEPPLTSGFGGLIDKEHVLRTSIADCLGHIGGSHAAELTRVLRHQQTRLDASIALLEQRYEGLSTGRQPAESSDGGRPTAPGRTSYEASEVLRDLGFQHASLVADLDALQLRAPDGRRGELIVAEVKRNHEEMAWMLTEQLRENAIAGQVAEENSPGVDGAMNRAQENWDSEGGPARPTAIDR